MNWPRLNMLDETESLMLHAKTRGKSGSILRLQRPFFWNLNLTQHIFQEDFGFNYSFLTEITFLRNT